MEIKLYFRGDPESDVLILPTDLAVFTITAILTVFGG